MAFGEMAMQFSMAGGVPMLYVPPYDIHVYDVIEHFCISKVSLLSLILAQFCSQQGLMLYAPLPVVSLRPALFSLISSTGESAPRDGDRISQAWVSRCLP